MTSKGEEDIDHDEVARLCTTAYSQSIPARGAKPARRSNGVLEWTVLAGLVVSYPNPLNTGGKRKYSLVSLATGLKCVSYTQVVQSHGDVVHDSHAEVLARRGARLWLLSRLEHERGAQTDCGPRLYEPAHDGRWKLATDVRLHLYVSTLPCGDASTLLFEFQRARQDVDAKRTGAASPLDLLRKYAIHAPSGSSNGTALSRGRAAGMNALRTKPGRPDSPPSISMSCSDKLALWAAIGIQGSMLSAVLEPVHISSVTVSDGALTAIGLETNSTDARAPAEQLKDLLRNDCVRSLNRAVTANGQVRVAFTAVQFIDSRESVDKIARQLDTQVASAPGSVLFVAPSSLGRKAQEPALALENLVGGTRLGASTKRSPVSPFLLKPAARSSICKLGWWNYVSDSIPALADVTTYWHAKRNSSAGTQLYRTHKQALLGDASDQAKIEAVDAFLANTNTSTTPAASTEKGRVGPVQEGPTFAGWLATPSSVEQFQADGST